MPNSSKWETEFKKKYTEIWSTKYSHFIRIPDGIKGSMISFISDLLSTQREELEHKIKLETAGRDAILRDYENYKVGIKEKIRGMVKDVPEEAISGKVAITIGYTQALSDVLKLLQDV